MKNENISKSCTGNKFLEIQIVGSKSAVVYNNSFELVK